MRRQREKTAEFLANFKGYDVQATRAEARREGLREGRIAGHEEGREEGREELLLVIICKKIKKNMTLEMIAADLEEDVEVIRPMYEKAKGVEAEENIAKHRK